MTETVKTAIHAGVWSTDPAPSAIAATLDAVASIGYDCLAVPLRNPGQLQTARIRALFGEAGVQALATAGLPAGCDIGSTDPAKRERGAEHLRVVVAVAAEIGVTQINGVLYGPLGYSPRPVDGDAVRRSAEVLSEIAEAAATARVRLCVELVNRYETAMLNTVAQGLDYLREVDHPNLLLHLDTFHLAMEERDPVDAIRRALPRLGYFELDQSHRGRLDQGALDLKALAAPVQAAGYRGLVGVEAFARTRLAPEHADTLAIWRDHFDDGTALARQAMDLIKEIFGGVRREAPFAETLGEKT